MGMESYNGATQSRWLCVIVGSFTDKRKDTSLRDGSGRRSSNGHEKSVRCVGSKEAPHTNTVQEISIKFDVDGFIDKLKEIVTAGIYVR